MRGKDQGDGPRSVSGGYDLLDRVGVGGGAVVVRARDRQLHRLVAVKLLRSRDADLRCRFAHESMVLAGMDHPAIVRVMAHDGDPLPATPLPGAAAPVPTPTAPVTASTAPASVGAAAPVAAPPGDAMPAAAPTIGSAPPVQAVPTGAP